MSLWDCVPDWYKNEGIYKADLTLSDWGDELLWRYQFRKKIIEKNENEGMSDEDRQAYRQSFLYSLQNKNDRKIEYCTGRNLSPPVEYIKVSYSDEKVILLKERRERELGIVLPLAINISYDRSTIDEWIKGTLDEAYSNFEKAIEESIKRKPLKASRGDKKFNESDACLWNKQKIIHWIDFDTYTHIVGEYNFYFTHEQMVEIFWHDSEEGKDVTYISGTVIPKAEELLNLITINRIRASARMDSNGYRV